MVGVGGYEYWQNHSFDGVYLAVVVAVVPSGGSHTAVVTMVMLVLVGLAMVKVSCEEIAVDVGHGIECGSFLVCFLSQG